MSFLSSHNNQDLYPMKINTCANCYPEFVYSTCIYNRLKSHIKAFLLHPKLGSKIFLDSCIISMHQHFFYMYSNNFSHSITIKAAGNTKILFHGPIILFKYCTFLKTLFNKQEAELVLNHVNYFQKFCLHFSWEKGKIILSSKQAILELKIWSELMHNLIFLY